MFIGGRDHACRCVVVVSSASADRVASWPPCSLGILSGGAVPGPSARPALGHRGGEGTEGARERGATHFQTMTFSAGTYFALPTTTLHSARIALSGVGMRRTMPLADSLPSKLALRWIVYSTLDLPTSLTIGCRRNGRLMFVVERYLQAGQGRRGQRAARQSEHLA